MALTSQLVTFKSWWLSPKEVQIRLYRQTPLPSKRGSPASHLRCLRRDRADLRRDEDRQDRARLIATLSDCVTAKRRRRAAPAAAVCCGAGTRSRNTDRQFWICASRWFPGWRRSLLIAKPETVCGTLAADPAGESPAGGNCPVATAMGR